MYRRFFFLCFLAGAFACTGCQDRADWAAQRGILLLGNGGEPKTLDPGLVQSVGDANIMQALFEGLVNYHLRDDRLDAPGVAESWESRENAKVWTFHLRNNARWSNGDPVTAHDFVYAFERNLSPRFASEYASMLYLLENAEDFNKGKLDHFAQVGVRALDDLTLECRLRQPTAYFPGVVKHHTWYPVHRATVERFGKMTDRFAVWQRAGNHVGNGAFRLKEWRVNQWVAVVPNPHYWDASAVKLSEIRFFPLETFTEERIYRGGQLHYTYTLPNTLIEKYRRERPELLRVEPYLGSYFFRCNVQRPPFDDPKVRQALALAIDREKIVRFITMGGQLPATGFTPPIEGVYTPLKVLRFDPERARQLLAESKYPVDRFPSVELLINTSEQHRKIAEAVQDMWKQHLGLGKDKVRINNQEWKVFQDTTFRMDYDLSRAAWIADYVDPATFLDMWRTGDSNNFTGWGNPEYDALLQQAALESTPGERMARLHRAEQILLEELPILPLYWYSRVYLLDHRVRNWYPMVMDRRDYRHVYFEPRAAAP